MKKLLTTLAVAGLTVAVYAQGTVNWIGVGSAFQGQTNGTVYSTFESSAGAPAASGTQGLTMGNSTANNTALGYTGYYYELLIGSAASAPTTLGQLSSWFDTGLVATNGGVSNGRIVQVGQNSQAAANGWVGGTTTNVVLVGWSANLGSTWTAALANLNNWSTVQSGFTGANTAYFGVSILGTLTAGTGNPGVTVFGPGVGQINDSAINNPAGIPEQLFALPVTTIPEPASMALVALGGASLLLFRRRK